MPLILVCIFIFPLSLAIAHKFTKKLIQAMPFCLLGIAAFQYLLGLFGLLYFGVWLLRGVWAFSCAYLIYALFKKKLTLQWLASECVFPAAFVLFAWWLCRGRSFVNWDEFSHWGIALKGMFYQDVLPSVSTFSDVFKNYPPIIGVLQYSVCKIVGLTYREDVVLFIQAVLACSLLAYPLLNIRSAFGKAIMLASLLLLPLTIYPYIYTTTIMDGVLGIIFGFALLVYATKDNSLFDLGLLFLAAFALCLTKTTGILFFAFVAVIVLIDILIKKQHTIRAFLPLIVSCMGATLAQLSWGLHLAVHNVPQKWSASSFSLTALFDLIFKGQPKYRVDTVTNFFKNIVADFNYGSLIHFPFIAWSAIFALGIFLMNRLAKQSISKTNLRTTIFICSAGVIYTLLTLGTYLFVFDELEAVSVASISRYLNTFLIAILMFMLGALAQYISTIKLKQGIAFITIYLIGWLLLISPSPAKVLSDLFNAPKSAAVSANSARVYAAAGDLILQATNNRPERVRLISQFDYGYTYIRMAYETLPYKMPDGVASIRAQENAAEDIWSEYYTTQALQSHLGEYDFVYIVYTDQMFIDKFSVLFQDPDNISNHTLYAVNKDNGKISLSIYAKAAV